MDKISHQITNGYEFKIIMVKLFVTVINYNKIEKTDQYYVFLSKIQNCFCMYQMSDFLNYISYDVNESTKRII